MILYFVQFEHIQTGIIFYKVGMTGTDVPDRFNHNKFTSNRFRYKEFNITTLAVKHGTQSQVEYWENYLISVTKKYEIRSIGKFIGSTEHYTKHTGFTGSTEVRDLTEKQAIILINFINKVDITSKI